MYVYDYKDPQVGDVVYPGYTPVQAGKIISVRDVHMGVRVTVRQPSGKEYTKLADHLQCYRTLISDHKRKLKTHEDRLDKILREEV